MASELDTRATRGVHPGGPVTGQEAVTHLVKHVVQPRRYFVYTLPWLANLHITGKDITGGGMRGDEDAWYRIRKVAEAESRLELTPKFTTDMEWLKCSWSRVRDDRETANCPVLPVREAVTVEIMVLGRIIPGGGRILFKTGW